MLSTIVRSILNGINKILRIAHMEIIRTWNKEEDFSEYIPFHETIQGAKKHGLSVGEYIETKFNVAGTTQETIDQLANQGVFSGKIERVCEIGPGSGRYLERVIQICKPDYYEVYETAENWNKWLVETYKVTGQPSDGKTLGGTESDSIDLVHAHKVFPGLPVLTVARYFQEMARVARKGGYVVFDLLTESCLDPVTLKKWIDSGITYPCSMFAKKVVNDYMETRGCKFVGSFMVVMNPGTTEVMIYQKIIEISQTII